MTTTEGAPVKRLPPGPVPDEPFIDAKRELPRFACRCGAQRAYGGPDDTKIVGRCGCARKS